MFTEILSENEIKNIISNIKPKTPQEILEMIIEYRHTGDKFILDEIIIQNYKLVYKLAYKYSCKFSRAQAKFDMMDLFQEGLYGVYVAIDRFDINKKIKFSTYAHYWVIQRIERFINGNIYDLYVPESLSVRVRSIFNKIINGQDFTVKELQQELKSRPEVAMGVYDLLYNKYTNVNYIFDEESKQKNDVESCLCTEEELFEDVIANNDEIKYLIDIIMNNLNEREKYVFTNYYGLNNIEPKNIVQLGDELDVSHQYVSLVLRKGRERLKKILDKKYKRIK